MKLHMIPAGPGDCLLLEYGNSERHCVLIDGGIRGTSDALTARLRELGYARLELVVVTHVDSDHIDGILELVDRDKSLRFEDLWFNGYEHMRGCLGGAQRDSRDLTILDRKLGAADELGPIQGRMLERLVEKGPWNEAFGRKAIVVSDGQKLPRVVLKGGLSLTVLSPTQEGLGRMARLWGEEWEVLDRSGLDLGKGEDGEWPDLLGAQWDINSLASEDEAVDSSGANGSSIALLAEYGASSILLAGDAWPDVLVSSIRRLLAERGERRLKLSALKVPHHGSKRNLTSELLSLIDAERFLLSTNGARTHHPDPQTIARIITACEGSHLFFSASTSQTSLWGSAELQAQYGFRASYPAKNAITVVEC